MIRNKVYITQSDYSKTGNQIIRAGTISDGDISWGEASIAARGKLSPREGYVYYPDVMLESDGRFSFTCRHNYSDESSKPHLDPAFVVSSKPGDITSWERPINLIVLPEPQTTDGHENIPLPDGKRVLIFRTHCKVFTAGRPTTSLHSTGTEQNGRNRWI